MIDPRISPCGGWKISPIYNYSRLSTPEEIAQEKIIEERVRRQDQLRADIMAVCRENCLECLDSSVLKWLKELDDAAFNHFAGITLEGNEATLNRMRQLLIEEQNRRSY
jgi:hypothetical protein